MSGLAIVGLLAVGVVWLLALSLHSTVARLSHGYWRGVEAARVPVNAAPMGAFRDEGTLSVPFDGVPRPVRRASLVASVAAVAYLPQPFVLAGLIALVTDGALEQYWLPAFLVGLLVSYACVLQLDGARLALLRRAPEAAWRAGVAFWLVAVPHAALVAASAALPLALEPQPAAVWIAFGVCDLLSLGLVAAAVVVRRAAVAHRGALEQPERPLP
jgi:hypothetical protein